MANFHPPLESQVHKIIIKQYQSAINSHIWLAIYTGADIFYLVRIHSRYYVNPDLTNCKLVFRIFYYFAGILD